LTLNSTRAILLLSINRTGPGGSARKADRSGGGDRVTPNDSKRDVLQGTLDLLVLKTLETMGPLHGWGVARRARQPGTGIRVTPGRRSDGADRKPG